MPLGQSAESVQFSLELLASLKQLLRGEVHTGGSLV